MKTDAYIVENYCGTIRYTPVEIIRRTKTTIVVLEHGENGAERTFNIPKYGDRHDERGHGKSYRAARLGFDIEACEAKKANAEAERSLRHRAREVSLGLEGIIRRMTCRVHSTRTEEEIAACEALIARFNPATAENASANHETTTQP